VTRRRVIVLSATALALVTIAVAGYAVWGRKLGKPFAPSQERGAVVPAAEYRLSGPYTHANLTVFLVHGPETLAGTSFLTLQEALERKTVVVHETGSVNELEVENVDGSEDVFIQSGDIVKGGKQDRTFQYDAVIGPRSGRVPLASFCVEQGRWSKRKDESSSYFSSSSSNVSTSENRRAASSPSESGQSTVWRNVANTQEKLSKKLGTSVKSAESASSLQLTLESTAVRDAVGPYAAALRPALQEQDDAIGFVAVIDGRIVAADVYASRALFRKLWPKLLDGAAVEAFIEAEPGRTSVPVTADAVRAFLTEPEGLAPTSDAGTERTYVQVRQTDRVVLVEYCDRARANLVLHRCFLAR
jgi:hypothetical protein